MRKVVIYDGTFEITARELLFSVIIVLVMMTVGFFINEEISSSADERNQEYEQAAKIDGDKELFEYGMRTDIGNAFVYGTLKAVNPVSLPELEGEYAYILKTKEKYTMHTRTVTHSDGKRTWTTTEIYYTWDVVEYEDFVCDRITFLDHEFEYGTIKFPKERYLKTINKSSKIRYLYYVCDVEYPGTIYTRLGDNTISKTTLIEGKNISDAVEYMNNSLMVGVIIFWIFWIVLIGAAVYGFYYLDNRWLED